MTQLPMFLGARLFSCVAALLSASAGCARSDRVIAVQLDGGQGGESASAGAQGARVGVAKDAEALLSNAGLTNVALGGYLNGESYQQDGIVSYRGYQYAAFWNSKRHVVLERRALPDGAWSAVELTDYANVQSAAANTISIGISPGDGTLHLSFDNNREGALHYRRSVAGLADAGSSAAWSLASFSDVTSELVPGTPLTQGVGYPRFVSEPGGKLLLELSIADGNANTDEYLWEYASDTQAWVSVGRFIAGIDASVGVFIHGLSYSRNGTRLHVSWCWRDSVDPSTNHDLLYAYSDDNGRTWQDGSGELAATSGASAISTSSPGVQAWAINKNRGMLNQEHMTIDTAGQVHVLLSHLPDDESDDSDFVSARAKSEFFHYLRDTSGHWTRTALNLRGVLNFRGKLAIASSGNAYAILPDLRIAAASAAAGYGDWTLLDSVDSGRFFSDPLIDSARLVSEDELTIFYPQKSSSNLYVLDYALR